MGGGTGGPEASTSSGKEITLEHAGYDYVGYKGRKGLLDLKVYKEVLRRAREYRSGHNISAERQNGGIGGGGKDSFSEVQDILEHAKIHEPGGKPLTVRNQPQVFIYQALNDVLNEHPELETRYASKGWKKTNEQKVAETLKILGDETSLNQLREKSTDKDLT